MINRLKLRKKKYLPPFTDEKRERNYIPSFNTLKLCNNASSDSKNLCFVNTILQLIYRDENVRKYFTTVCLFENKVDKMPVCLEIKKKDFK